MKGLVVLCLVTLFFSGCKSANSRGSQTKEIQFQSTAPGIKGPVRLFGTNDGNVCLVKCGGGFDAQGVPNDYNNLGYARCRVGVMGKAAFDAEVDTKVEEKYRQIVKAFTVVGSDKFETLNVPVWSEMFSNQIEPIFGLLKNGMDADQKPSATLARCLATAKPEVTTAKSCDMLISGQVRASDDGALDEFSRDGSTWLAIAMGAQAPGAKELRACTQKYGNKAFGGVQIQGDLRAGSTSIEVCSVDVTSLPVDCRAISTRQNCDMIVDGTFGVAAGTFQRQGEIGTGYDVIVPSGTPGGALLNRCFTRFDKRERFPARIRGEVHLDTQTIRACEISNLPDRCR